jgi:prepilin-type N-terminal cleavage/methylation domain-containing protein
MKLSKAFTLIELLVVVAIIAVLIAILMPSLSSARDYAKTISCSSNLKQFGIATAFYNNEYRDSMPLTGGMYPDGKPFNNTGCQYSSNNWMVLLSKYLPSNTNPNGYFAEKQGSLWICPADTRPTGNQYGDPAKGTGYYQCPSYGINIFLTGFYWDTGEWQKKPRMLGEITEPTRTPLMSDNDHNWGCYPAHIQDSYGMGFHPFPHFHRNADTFLYVDGHVGVVPNLDDGMNAQSTMWRYITANKYFTQERKFWD